MDGDTIISQIESFGVLAKIGISILMILLSLIFSRYVIIRPWFKLVKKTKNELDDLLVVPISNRLYFFIFVGGLNFSVNLTASKGDSSSTASSGRQ